MKLNVFVHGQAVAVLESLDGFEHCLRYVDDAPQDAFISLTMPVEGSVFRWPVLRKRPVNTH